MDINLEGATRGTSTIPWPTVDVQYGAIWCNADGMQWWGSSSVAMVYAMVYAAVDAMVDAMADVMADTMVDAIVDAMVGVMVDAMVDAMVDTTIGAMVDTMADVMVDTTVDAMVDRMVDDPRRRSLLGLKKATPTVARLNHSYAKVKP